MRIHGINGVKIQVVGDLHLGKVFRIGVPPHRLNEREEMVWRQFQEELKPGNGVKAVIQLGDIFDKDRVDLDVVWRTADIILAAAEANRSVFYYFLRGNHDAHRDSKKKSSFDVLVRLCLSCPNVAFVKDRAQVIRVDEGQLLLCPWDPFRTAREIVAEWESGRVESADGSQVHAAFGHWDHVSIESDFNLVPLEELHKHTDLVFSGHDHKARFYKRCGVGVVVVGSIQPYKHGEDAVGKLYVTTTLANLLQNPEAFKHKCVRIRLQQGESLPLEIDCLQITGQRMGGTVEPEPLPPEPEPLDIPRLLAEQLTAANVDERIQAEVKAKYEEKRIC